MGFVIAAFAIMLSGSCSLYSFTDTIIIDLPAVPAIWEPTIATEGITLSYLAGDDTIRSVDLAAGTRHAELRIPKRSVVSVVAVFRTADASAVLMPAGAVYPWHVSDSDRLSLSWQHGFVSSVLLSCTASRAQAVNVAKLTDIVLERSSGNPWILDPAILRKAIEMGQLDSRSISKLSVFDLEVLGASGRWVSGNPLDTSILESSGSTLLLSGLPEAVHSFFCIDSGERVDIAADTDGWAVVFPNRGTGSTGMW